MITELFYSHILNMKRGSLHTRSFRCIQFSVFRYRWTKNGFTGPKSFRGFRETGPRPLWFSLPKQMGKLVFQIYQDQPLSWFLSSFRPQVCLGAGRRQSLGTRLFRDKVIVLTRSCSRQE